VGRRPGRDAVAAVPVLSGLRRLARNVAQADAWSPAGNRLLFDSGDGYLYVIGRDGRRRRRLALINSNFDSHVVWSADGRSVAFQACRPGRDPDVCDVRSTR
jgi:Tol biopolymer transport system component